MKKSELKSIVKECVVGWLNEISDEHVKIAEKNFKNWLSKSPTIAQNLQKLRAEPDGSGSMWGVFLYDNRGNKMRLSGGMTPQIAKTLLPKIKEKILSMVPAQPLSTVQPQQPQSPLPVGGQPQQTQQMPTPGTDTDTTMFMKKEGQGLGPQFAKSQRAWDMMEPEETPTTQCPKCGEEADITDKGKKGQYWWYKAHCPSCGHKFQDDNF